MPTIQSLYPDIGFGTSGVRALVSQLTDEVVHAFTTAFIRYISESRLGNGCERVILAHDLRPSSPGIAAACAVAIDHAGPRTEYAGAVPTPALALRAQATSAPGIMITGSHIPFDRNGIKFYMASGEILKHDEQGIRGVQIAAPDSSRIGVVRHMSGVNGSAREAYRRRYLDFFDAGLLAGFRIGLYEHSSVARDLLHELFAALGAQVIGLGRSDDFVPIDTEAVNIEDQARAKAWCDEHRLDAVVSTDGDADRPLMFNEKGECLRGDVIGMLTASFLGADAVATPVSSNTALERSRLFRTVLRTRIGSPYVIAGMQRLAEVDGRTVVGYEANGGFLLGSSVHFGGRRLDPLPTRDATLPILAVFALARRLRVPISGLSAGLPSRHTDSGRLRDVPTAAGLGLLERLYRNQADRDRFFSELGAVDQVDVTDGFRATLASGEIVHLRPSGNAPELRCYTEADSPARAQALLEWGLGRLGRFLTI